MTSQRPFGHARCAPRGHQKRLRATWSHRGDRRSVKKRLCTWEDRQWRRRRRVRGVDTRQQLETLRKQITVEDITESNLPFSGSREAQRGGWTESVLVEMNSWKGRKCFFFFFKCSKQNKKNQRICLWQKWKEENGGAVDGKRKRENTTGAELIQIAHTLPLHHSHCSFVLEVCVCLRECVRVCVCSWKYKTVRNGTDSF